MNRTSEQILFAALKLFGERGFKGATIRDIAREANVSPSVVLYHYESKENLYYSIIKKFASRNLETALSFLGDKKRISNKEEFLSKLEQFFLFIYRTITQYPEFNKIIEREKLMGFSHSLDLLKEVYAKHLNGIVRFIKSGKEGAIISPDVNEKLLAISLELWLREMIYHKDILHNFNIVKLDSEEQVKKIIKDLFFFIFNGIFIK